MADLITFIEPYLATITAQGLAPKTVLLRSQQLRQVMVQLRRQGVIRTADLRAEDLDQHLQQLRERGLARATVASIRDAIAGFSRWLVQHGKVLRDPADGLSVATAWEEELPPPPLSEEQVRVLLDSVPRHDDLGLRNAAQLELLYGCGLRLSESLGLNLDDIDRHQRVVHIDEATSEAALDTWRGYRDHIA